MKKAFFIMIFILLAALFGAAQGVIVVYEGAKTNHFVAEHPGYQYSWRVLNNLNPETEAPPENYGLSAVSGTAMVNVLWKHTGQYYLRVIETDPDGCSNIKVLPVQVVANDRFISFATLSGGVCFTNSNNSFNLPLQISGNGGGPLEESYFPLKADFTVNGILHSQLIAFDKQYLEIAEEMFFVSPQFDNTVTIELSGVSDSRGNPLHFSPGKEVYVHTIYLIPEIDFTSFTGLVEQGTKISHIVEMKIGNSANAEYRWSVNPVEGTSSDFSNISGNVADIFWNGPVGIYNLNVQATDRNGCASNIVSQKIEIYKKPVPPEFEVSAGPDIVIGNCKPFTLNVTHNKEPGISYSYQWKPAENLDNAKSANPVFNPGKTTMFVVEVINSNGQTATDSVLITVENLVASAGKDISMLPGSTAILNGSASTGSNLAYFWATKTGNIVSGTNTPNPVVSGFGEYYLTVTDKYGCTGTDTVEVIRLAHAPVAVDDYDTTSYRREVIIDVLANDKDASNSINPASLVITYPPFYGTAYVDFNDYKVHYRPGNNFTGTDQFEYRICNAYNLCDEARVIVLVTDFKFKIPNAFSPNGDGINDYFEILGIEFYENNSITIINRWGNKVYEAKGYGISSSPIFWDGKSNTGFRLGNENLPTGTYYYILDLGNGEKPISGSIYLDR